MTLAEEFQSRNFSIYAQWLGILSMVLCFALGITNLVTFWRPLFILFGVFALVEAFITLFLEVPLLLRICPTSEKFDTFIRGFQTNYLRAAIYLAMSITLWLSLLVESPNSLIAPALFLLFTAICYGLAGVKGQGFIGSKTLGGQGLAQMIV